MKNSILSQVIISAILICSLPVLLMAQTNQVNQNRLPVAWTTYKKVVSFESDMADLKAHGIGLINASARNAEEAKEKLRLARQYEIKYHIGLPEITESKSLVKNAGFDPVDALMIGGVYQGKAIDRHLFRFEASKNQIIIEPPVYNKRFAYTTNGGSTGDAGKGDPIGHYYPDMPDPIKAEIIVPLKKFDGKQHLRIISAEISIAPQGSKPENDSCTPDLPVSPEILSRKLYQVSFDLSGLDNALLDQIGIAVYWPYHGTKKYWIFSNGNVSAAAPGTRIALQKAVQKELSKWTEANNGVFPSDVVVAARMGDECFYITGHSQVSDNSVVSYPLWEYSDPTIEAFRKLAGKAEYPRTWGFPEIYGEEAYGWWLYNLHQLTAGLAGTVRSEIAKLAPGLKLFRNTTRMGIFDLSNNFDGTGQELLTRNLDIVHLDPYPVSSDGYNNAIPRDMSYCAGLARRYNKLLIPWMQAHIYSKMQHVTPEQVDRMAQEQCNQGVDGIIWLGYGDTFPEVRPDSWERAAEFHKKLETGLPPKPKARLAVLRPYNKIALMSLMENGQVRNPDDWLLQQFLEVWAVQLGQPYDVFETPPKMTAKQESELKKELKKYSFIVSSSDFENAWNVDEMNYSVIIDKSASKYYQEKYIEKISKLGWETARLH